MCVQILHKDSFSLRFSYRINNIWRTRELYTSRKSALATVALEHPSHPLGWQSEEGRVAVRRGEAGRLWCRGVPWAVTGKACSKKSTLGKSWKASTPSFPSVSLSSSRFCALSLRHT